MVRPACIVHILFAFEAPDLLYSIFEEDRAAKFLKLGPRWKALDEIFKIYKLLHLSAFKKSAKFRQTFSHF